MRQTRFLFPMSPNDRMNEVVIAHSHIAVNHLKLMIYNFLVNESNPIVASSLATNSGVVKAIEFRR